jgi:hypothetical protein
MSNYDRRYQIQKDQPPSDEYMDRYLTNKASALRYPTTPDIASVVARRLAADKAANTYSANERALRPRTRHTGLAVVCIMALALLTLVAVPQMRAFVGNLSVGVWRIVRNAPEAPNVPGVPTITPVYPWDPHLGGETDLGSAIAAQGTSVMLPSYPADLGLPDHVYYQHDLNNMMIFVWMEPDQPDMPAVALYRFLSTTMEIKVVAPDDKIITQMQQVTDNSVITIPLKVGGSKATWIEGQYLFNVEHIDDKGKLAKQMSDVMDGNTLVWQPVGSTYSFKLVTHTTLNEAVHMAESLKPLSPPPTPYPTKAPTSPSSRLDVSGETGLYKLDTYAGFKLEVPAIVDIPELIAPDRIYLQSDEGMGKTVIMAWYTPGRTDDLRMVMMQGTWDDSIDAMNTQVTKHLQTTTIRGNSAEWIAENTYSIALAQHPSDLHRYEAQWVEGPQYMYVNTTDGKTELAARSFIANSHTLAWQVDGIKYRLETDLPLEDAIQVAESMR